jgi:hypothetical protein
MDIGSNEILVRGGEHVGMILCTLEYREIKKKQEFLIFH